VKSGAARIPTRNGESLSKAGLTEVIGDASWFISYLPEYTHICPVSTIYTSNIQLQLSLFSPYKAQK
jgi:hypothetical protein